MDGAVAEGKPVKIGSTGAPLSLEQTSLSQNETQWDIAASRTIKILIKEEAWYRSKPAGIGGGRTQFQGQPEEPTAFCGWSGTGHPRRGQDDSRFDSKDFIEFYATGLDTPFTDTRTYYLLEGEVLGQRIMTSEGIGEEPVSDSFPFSVTFKERVYYFPEIKNGETDNFFGPAIAPLSVLDPGYLDVTIGVSNIVPFTVTQRDSLKLLFRSYGPVP